MPLLIMNEDTDLTIGLTW